MPIENEKDIKLTKIYVKSKKIKIGKNLEHVKN